MSQHSRNGMFMLGGIVLGMAAAVVLGQQKSQVRPAIAGLISRGLDVKDQAVTALEVVKEQTEDLFAEAEDLRHKRLDAQPAAPSGDASAKS